MNATEFPHNGIIQTKREQMVVYTSRRRVRIILTSYAAHGSD